MTRRSCRARAAHLLAQGQNASNLDMPAMICRKVPKNKEGEYGIPAVLAFR